jgi:hypothetical protein
VGGQYTDFYRFRQISRIFEVRGSEFAGFDGFPDYPDHVSWGSYYFQVAVFDPEIDGSRGDRKIFRDFIDP